MQRENELPKLTAEMWYQFIPEFLNAYFNDQEERPTSEEFFELMLQSEGANNILSGYIIGKGYTGDDLGEIKRQVEELAKDKDRVSEIIKEVQSV